MSKYTRRNRLNKLGKLNIIINELQQEINKKENIRSIFIIPTCLTIFKSVINYDNSGDLLTFIVQYAVITLIAFMTVTAFYKMYDCKTFNKYTGIERLKELLVHVSIKHGK